MKLTAFAILISLAAMAEPAPKITTNFLASSLFFDPAGNTGFVTVIRQTDPVSLATTTSLFYSFCVQTTAALCQQGNGVIPDSSLRGQVRSNSSPNNVLTLLADTNVSGFTNEICQSEDGFPFNCVPATGGIVSASFAKTDAFDETIDNTDLIRRQHKKTGSRFDITQQFSAQMTGTVLGVTADTQSITGIVSFETLQQSGEDAPQAEAMSSGLTRILASQGRAGLAVLRKVAK